MKTYICLLLGLFALGITVAVSLVTYQTGTTVVAKLDAGGWLQWITGALCGVPTVALGIVAWYAVSSLALRLRSKRVGIEWNRAKVNDFTPTERGFAPRLIDGKIINPNVVPSAITPVNAVECPEEIPEERRLAGVIGWHLSNAPVQQGARQIAQQVALPVPEPKPAPWEISHVERLLLEAGEE